MAVVREGIEIVVTQKGAVATRKEIERVGKAGTKSAAGVKGLAASLKLLATGIVAREIVTLIDTFTNMQNRLKLVTTGTENLKKVTNELGDIARRTRTSFEGTATIFSRVALATKELGVTQQELLQFTESLNQAVILSGSSSKEAFNGIIQLSQGMGAGALRGDELRSVLEQLPGVADTIARGMGVARSALRDLGTQGAITSRVILDAFAKDRQRLILEFANTVPTLGQAFEVVKTDVIFFLATLDEVVGASSKVAEAMIFLGGHIGEIGFIAIGVATFFATKYVLAMLAAETATKRLAVAMAFLGKNKIALIISAIVAVIGYLATFRQQMSEAGGAIGAIGQAINGLVIFFTVLIRSVSVIGKALIEAFSTPQGAIAGFSVLASAFALIFAKDIVRGFKLARTAWIALRTALLLNPFTVIIAAIAAAVTAIVVLTTKMSTLKALVEAIGRAFGKLWGIIKQALSAAGLIKLGSDGNIILEVEAKEAASDLNKGIDEGGKKAAKSIENGMISGGKKAAASMKKAGPDVGKEAAKKLRDGAPSAGKDLGDAAAAPLKQAGAETGAVFSAAGVTMSQAAFDIAGSTGRFQEAVNLMFRAIRAQVRLVELQGDLLDAQRIQIQESRSESKAERMSRENIARANNNAAISVARINASASQTTASSSSAASALGGGDDSSTKTVRGPFETAASLARFAEGGSFDVSGKSGVDNNTLSVNNRPVAKVSKGETVTVSPEEKKRRKDSTSRVERPTIIQFNVTATDADSFQRSQQQIEARLSATLARSNERNN